MASGIPSGKILTFLGPLFRYFREVGTLTEVFKGKKVSLELVGGAVRDHVINTDPRVQKALRSRGRGHLIGRDIKDLDLSTNASPETVVELVRALANADKLSEDSQDEREAKWWSQWANYKVKYIEGLGEQHGTVTLAFNYEGSGVEDQQIEITTHRTEEYNDEGRKPSQVTFSDESADPDESRHLDSTRRDLSFNSMYMDSTGKVIDPHKGVDDLILGTLNIPTKKGETSYQAALRVLREDPLRFLRWIRFSGAYAAKPTSDLLNAIRSLKGSAKVTLSDGKVLNLKDLDLAGLIESRVAGNRKQVELGKILSHGGYADGLQMLNSSGVYKNLLPHAADYGSVRSTLVKLDQMGVKGVGLLAVLYLDASHADIAHDLGSSRVDTGDKKEDARRSLNFSASEIKLVQSLVDFIHLFKGSLHSSSPESVTKHLVELVGPYSDFALAVLLALSPQDKTLITGTQKSLHAMKGGHIKHDLSGLNYPELSGGELIKETGLKGPALGLAMELIKEGFRRHDLQTREEALSFAHQVADKLKQGIIDPSLDKSNRALIRSTYVSLKGLHKLSAKVVQAYLSLKKDTTV